MRLYISGPMTGLPDFNYPAFNAEAARLRALGYHIENPAENPQQDSWAAYMKQSCAQMLTCDAIAVLPNWSLSKGARIEVQLAAQCGMRFMRASEIKGVTTNENPLPLSPLPCAPRTAETSRRVSNA